MTGKVMEASWRPEDAAEINRWLLTTERIRQVDQARLQEIAPHAIPDGASRENIEFIAANQERLQEIARRWQRFDGT